MNLLPPTPLQQQFQQGFLGQGRVLRRARWRANTGPLVYCLVISVSALFALTLHINSEDINFNLPFPSCGR